MKTLLHFPNRRVEVEQATAWIIKLERGLRDREREELSRWLDSARNRDTLLEMAELWDRVDMLAELAELFPLREETLPRRRALAWSAAAVAVVLMAAALTAFHFLRETHFTRSYITAVGEQRTIELPDHSKILLNTNTDLQVDFSSTARLIAMTGGEANFEVAKDPARPFTVRVAGIDFVAVGTAFNVRNDAARGVSLTVSEGRVHVQENRAAAGGGERAIESGGRARADLDVLVGANAGVVIDPVTMNIDTLARSEVAEATAWQQGMAIFDHTPLQQVVAEFNRYLATPIVIVDSELADLPVSGFFRVSDIDGLALALKRNFDIDVQRKDDAIMLSVNRSK